MEQFKKAQVIMLPTNNKSNIVIINKYNDKAIGTTLENKYLQGGGGFIYNSSLDNSSNPQHVYVISDDEIKEGDWVLSKLNELVLLKRNYTNYNYKKIIATTDTSLIYKMICVQCIGYGETTFSGTYTTQKVCDLCNGKGSYLMSSKLPQPSQQFIEKYIEFYNRGDVITDVLVEYELYKTNPNSLPIYGKFDYKLKVNTNDNTITIKKLKDSWSRDEIIKHIKSFANEFVANTAYKQFDIDNWINENL